MRRMYVIISKDFLLYKVRVKFVNSKTGEVYKKSIQYGLGRRMAMSKAIDNIYWGDRDRIFKDIHIVNKIDNNFIKDLVLNLKNVYNINITRKDIINDYKI